MTATVAAPENAAPHRRRRIGQLCNEKGYTLLELVVVVIIVCILFLVALDKLWELQTTAERATMEYNVGALRSALALQFVDRIVHGDEEGIRALAGSNPMTMLNQIPGNYLGEFENIDPATLESGNWYFDKRQKLLVYLVRNSHFFRSSLSGPARVRWSVHLDIATRSRNDGSGAVVEKLEGISLVPQDLYVWRVKEEK